MVMIVDNSNKPLSPTTKARARMLLKRKDAYIYKYYPFVIKLKENKNSVDNSYTLKVDPGANVTGIAIVDKDKCYFFMELIHRGKEVKKLLTQRRAVRRARRNRLTRYRKPRFNNRTKVDGWLAPSVKSRADNIINWCNKLSKYIPINEIIIENVSFDISSLTEGKQLYGKEYQNGTLKDTRLREYIFKKYNKTCVYCNGESKDKRLNVEHVISKDNGGTNSVNNLVLSYRKCNKLKDNLSLKEFGKVMCKDYSHLIPKETPKSASIVQSARNYCIKELSKNFKVKSDYGWKTKLNREELNLPKEHYYDAMCVGEYFNYKIVNKELIVIKAKGRGSRQMCRVDKYGFPRTSAKSFKSIKGFSSGDMVKASVPKGKKKGNYIGCVAIRDRKSVV